MLLWSGCTTINPRSIEYGRMKDEETLVAMTVLHHYNELRTPNTAYRFSVDSYSYSERLKEYLSQKIPEFSYKDEPKWMRVDINKVDFPEDGYAFIELYIGDPLYGADYVTVFKKQKDLWQLIDYGAIATGNERLTTKFSWETYRKNSKINK